MPATQTIRIFVQARMSSDRLPGKVLAPFRGKPLIDHVMSVAMKVGDTVLVTSDTVSDDPLATHGTARGWKVFRGDLNNVFKRFRDAARAYPSQWIVRISGDSPLILSDVIYNCINAALDSTNDVVTNVRPRSFPKGQSVEVVRASLFEGVPIDKMQEEEREHVTPYFYSRPELYKIHNIARPDDFPVSMDCVVDTLEDLKRLEAL